jgi:hypothetical protein
MPWNYSFLALEGSYCKPISARQFVNFILQTNADRWRDSLGFLTTDELAAYWASFHGARPKLKTEAAKTSKKEATNTTTSKKEKRVRFPWVDVCHQWNTGKCSKAPGTCTLSRGTVLHHVCDWHDLANPAVICGQAHKRLQFH